MFNQFFIWALLLSTHLDPLHAATSSQGHYGSNAIPAGNPNIPSFALTQAQTDQLPPIPPDVYADSLLPAPLIAYKRGYATEVHRVVTPDGYILEVHRITSSPHRRTSNKNNQVAFLQHGFLDSSATWVMSGEDHGLGYALADSGYDVWMGNARGNVYSRKHVQYDPDGSREDREKFWTFTWHEIGVVDIPSMIDYVLLTTNQTQLHYIGHSQGTTSFFVMCSERPEYNEKIKLMHALAPVGYMNNAVSPVVRIGELVPTAIQKVAPLLGAYEVLPSLDFFKLIGQQLCRDTSPFIAICESVLFLITGFNEQNLNATLFPVYLSHTPAGASTYQLVHFVQEARSGRFCMFDWGSPEDNMAKYGSVTPPDYALNNVRSRVILHYSDNDWLSAPIDVERLHAKLPNAERHHIPDKKFEHMDFVWGIGAKSILYNPIIASMRLYDKIESTLVKRNLRKRSRRNYFVR